MVENRSSLFGIIAIIIGASGLGLGAFSVVSFQILEGPEGSPGQDGRDGIDGIHGEDGIDGVNGTNGEDAPGGLVVGILDPDQGEKVSDTVLIRALVYGSNNYSISVLRNDTEIGIKLPMVWNTTLELEGWYNITVMITDNETQFSASDEVMVLVNKSLESGVHRTYYLEPTYDSQVDGGGLSEYTCVFDPYGWYGFIFTVWVEPGELVHLTFEGYFDSPVENEYHFAFHEVISSTLVKLGLLNKYTIGGSPTTVHMERIIAGLSPGAHDFTMAISYAPASMKFFPRLIMAQTIIP